MHLPNLSPGEWLMVALASWVILSTVIAVPIGRALRSRPEPEAIVPATYPPPPPPSVRWQEYLPPVPLSEAQWLAAWPADVLSDNEISVRFQATVTEGWK